MRAPPEEHPLDSRPGRFDVSELDEVTEKLSQLVGGKHYAIRLYLPEHKEDVALFSYVPPSVDAEMIQTALSSHFHLPLHPMNLDVTQVNDPGETFDPLEALTQLYRKRSWKFPLPIEHLIPFLPHRPPAVWIDGLLETKKDYAKAYVRIRPNAPYKNSLGVCEVACIEWIAQTFGYGMIMNNILQIQLIKSASRTLIAEIKNLTIHDGPLLRSLPEDAEIEIAASCAHNFGALKIIEGNVTVSATLLASAKLTVFSA